MTQSSSLPKSRLVVAASSLIVMGALLHACGGGGGGGGGGGSPPAPSPGPGPTSFVSTSQFPALSAANVPVRPIVILGFSDTVNPATMSAATVSLSDGLGPVPSTLSYDPCNNRITLIPDVPLAASTVHTVNLTNGLQDDDGEGLTVFSYTFTTLATTDTERPAMSVFTADPNMGEETTQVRVTWTDASDGANPAATIAYNVYSSPQPLCFNFSSPIVTVAAGMPLEAVIPGLQPRTLYSIVVRAVDAAGNMSTNAAPVSVTTYTSLTQNVFQLVSTLCVGCHNPGGTATQNPYFINMNYSTPQTVRNSWVGAASQCAQAAANGFPTRVVAGDPGTSFLYNKISTDTPACGLRMPFGQTPLTAAQQSVFEDWISQGALDN